MDGVKMTVMKTEFYSDLVKDVDHDVQTETFGSCPIFKVGDVFIIKDVDTIPNGFCSWAWADRERSCYDFVWCKTATIFKKQAFNVFLLR
jgi:uncharacterized repeat protein (TIGR04076 family)